MKASRGLIVFVAVFLVVFAAGLGVAWWWGHRQLASDGRAPASAPPASAGNDEAPLARGLPLDPPDPSASAPARPVEPVLDRAKRDRMRELIWRAFGEATPPAAAPAKQRYVLPEHGPMWTGTEGIAGDAEPGIEPEYVQRDVRAQFFPLARKCYSDALEKDAKLQGEIDLWFVIVGDARVGGVVESVDVLDRSTLRDADVVECMRESFLGVTFPPPRGGGVVTVEYPIIFSPGDEEEEEDGGAKR